jgi:hypothetical protein
MPPGSMKRLVVRFFSPQVTALYPLCHKLLTMSSCSGSSPPGTVFHRQEITNISSGLFTTKPHRQNSSAVHALSHTHMMTLDERLTWHLKSTNRKQEEESSCDYYYWDQMKHCTVFIDMKRVSSLQ